MTARRERIRAPAALLAASLAGELLLAPAASASSGASAVPVGLFGLPSLHSIIQAIANGFFSALAGALVPSWLKHGTVATIQHLVALPDPATWAHVSALQGEMTYLAAMLLPVTLAVGAMRYWLIGLTGAAHPASAMVRCAAVTAVLVAYRWIVEQTVAATNTLSHGILGLPAVAGGLQRIIGVLFGGALLSGAGGVFGALLVIVGVVFAAGLFAAQVLLTVVLAVLIVAGPPLIALSAIPELSHLSRSWAYALLAVALVPVGWTVLFATAGALCLDATSFTGSGGGLPGHVAAAFAGLITFVIAARLPLMVLAQVGHLFTGQGTTSRGATPAPSRMPGGERVRAAHGRLRAIGLDGVPSLGRSAGRAAGALGAPQGGPVGAARRRLAGAARRSGVLPTVGAAAGAGAGVAAAAGARRGVRARLADAGGILASAPREAITATNASAQAARRRGGRRVPGGARRAGAPAARAPGARPDAASAAKTPRMARSISETDRTSVTAVPVRASRPPRAHAGRAPVPGASPVAGTSPPAPEEAAGPHGGGRRGASASRPPSPPRPPEMHPSGPPTASSEATTNAIARRPEANTQAPRGGEARTKPAPSNRPRPAAKPSTHGQGQPRTRKGRPRAGGQP
jgi:hypothetical protein